MWQYSAGSRMTALKVSHETEGAQLGGGVKQIQCRLQLNRELCGLHIAARSIQIRSTRPLSKFKVISYTFKFVKAFVFVKTLVFFKVGVLKLGGL
jgi:hypothetical protein